MRTDSSRSYCLRGWIVPALLISLLLLTACGEAPAIESLPAETAEPLTQLNPTSEPTVLLLLTDEPTEIPPATPTTEPTATPTSEPTQEPTQEPTAEPTQEPTQEPTAEPTQEPTETEAVARVDLPEASGSLCDIEHVVILSIDGLRPDALAATDSPNLDVIRRRGAYTASAQAVLPTVTLVNHASMLGGMSPEKHGILWNVNDPDLGFIPPPTLFTAAKEAGYSTALVSGKPKLQHVVIPNSVDTYIYAGFTDWMVYNDALPVIEAGLPNVFAAHLPDVDSAGHAAGWMSIEQFESIAATDIVVGEFVAALEAGGYLDTTLLLITSDHGGKGFRHGSAEPENVLIPWLAMGPGVTPGYEIQGEVVVYDTAATALYALDVPIPETWDGAPITEIFEDTSCRN